MISYQTLRDIDYLEKRLLKEKLLSNDSNKTWSSFKKIKKKYSLKSEDLKEQIQEWVRNYNNINHSPISNNAILVIDEEAGKK